MDRPRKRRIVCGSGVGVDPAIHVIAVLIQRSHQARLVRSRLDFLEEVKEEKTLRKDIIIVASRGSSSNYCLASERT